MNQDQPKEQLLVEALPGYTPEIGRYLWMLEDSRRRTKEVVQGVAQLVIDWCATEYDNRIGTLLYHIALIELDWLYAEVLEQEYPTHLMALFPYDVRNKQGQLSVVTGVSLDEHLQRLDTVRTALMAAFQSMSLEEFRRPRQLPSYDVTPEWVLYHLIEHETAHRGEIGEMRRLAEQDIF
ncbi:MAG: DinB family protein [Caldilineaceae bacterium]